MPSRKPNAITPGMALLPLRLFLGVTFVYAGYQKLSDPGYLTPGSATYIGTQLHAFANGTPGGFLLRWFALPEPRVAGVGVALAEIAIGLLTTVGLLTRAAAAAGLALNLVLFLTASWTTTPYFLGSDIVFCFAWLPLCPGGSGRPAGRRHAAPGTPGPGHRTAHTARRPRLRRGRAGSGDAAGGSEPRAGGHRRGRPSRSPGLRRCGEGRRRRSNRQPRFAPRRSTTRRHHRIRRRRRQQREPRRRPGRGCPPVRSSWAHRPSFRLTRRRSTRIRPRARPTSSSATRTGR